MKPNYIGIIGAILAFISLILPWWTITYSISIISYSDSLYLYQPSGSVVSLALANSWYFWAALILVIIGALLALAESTMGKGRMMLVVGGVLTLLSIIIFAVGLMMDLSSIVGFGVGLFSSGTIGSGEFFSASYSTYLSLGFWLALVAAILMFVGSVWKPKETMATPPAAPPAPTP